MTPQATAAGNGRTTPDSFAAPPAEIVMPPGDRCRLLIEPGQVVELRALEVKRGSYRPCTLAGFFDHDHLDKMAEIAGKLNAKGVYFTLNPLNPDLLARRSNRTDYADEGTLAKDKDVIRRRWLLVDADPVRDRYISASEEEKAHAWRTIRVVWEFLDARHWPGPIVQDSGNGFHLLYRVDLPVDDGGTVKRILEALAARFNTDHVTIDRAVFNPSRICKLPGTMARKGDHIPQRPHRLARILHIPGVPAGTGGPRCVELVDVRTVPAELLAALADEAPQPAQAGVAAAHTNGSNGHAAGNGEDNHPLKVSEWLTDRGVAFRVKPAPDSMGRTVYILARCPFDPSHVDPDACIMQHASGKTDGKCFHSSCAGRGWQQFKEAIGAPTRKHYSGLPPRSNRSNSSRNGRAAPPPRPLHDNGQPNEADDDPHRLARVFIWGHAQDLARTSRSVPPEHLRLRYWREEWAEWDGTAYRRVPTKEVRSRITDAAKAEFDRLNREALAFHAQRPAAADGEKTKGPPEVLKVTTGLTNSVLQALAGLTLLPATIEPPAWIRGAGPFPAEEVLAAQNALVHLPSLVRGTVPHACSPTLDFFSFTALDYAFDAAAPPPANWLAFLRQLWPDDSQSIDTLQEWMGYLLTPDTCQQKILMIVGPKRSGKGTISRVIRALIGPANVAGPTLSSLSAHFGLWPLLGKTAAIISDARLSGRSDMAAIVERLLSISGEDALTVDRKNLAPVTVKLATRLIVLTNELPRLDDASGALPSRLVMLHTPRSWYGKEDHRLADKLLPELPGVLLWAVAGWQRLQERGYFVQPASGQELLSELEDLSSPVLPFVKECCIVDGKQSVSVADLFGRWKEWCERENRKEGTTAVFGRNLLAAAPGVERERPRSGEERVRGYRGIGLKPVSAFQV